MWEAPPLSTFPVLIWPSIASLPVSVWFSQFLLFGICWTWSFIFVGFFSPYQILDVFKHLFFSNVFSTSFFLFSLVFRSVCGCAWWMAFTFLHLPLPQSDWFHVSGENTMSSNVLNSPFTRCFLVAETFVHLAFIVLNFFGLKTLKKIFQVFSGFSWTYA